MRALSHRRPGAGLVPIVLIATLSFGAMLQGCNADLPSAGEVRSHASLELGGERPCLRVPIEEQLAPARLAVARFAHRARISVDVSLECAGSRSVLYLINAFDKGIIYQSINTAGIPRTVNCCNGMVPLELNPSILAAPLRYFALDDDAERARSLAAKTPGRSFYDFNETRSGYPLKSPDGLYQPGYAVFQGKAPYQGACVIIVNLADSLQVHNRPEYNVDNQTFACVAKFFGERDMRTLREISIPG